MPFDSKKYHREYMVGWRDENPDKVKETNEKAFGGDKEKRRKYYLTYMRKWRVLNPRKLKSNSLKSDYGMTLEQYDEMLEACGNKCQICELPFEEKRKPHVDHCHKTKAIRGMLCGNCNRAEGILKTPETVLRLHAYMLKYANRA
jgi:Recombination endonuclease VII